VWAGKIENLGRELVTVTYTDEVSGGIDGAGQVMA
jgi:hypothetical protein